MVLLPPIHAVVASIGVRKKHPNKNHDAYVLTPWHSVLTQVTEGEIGPFSSIKVPITFTPVIPGEVHTKFKVMFKDPQSPTVSTPDAT